jgi:protease II
VFRGFFRFPLSDLVSLTPRPIFEQRAFGHEGWTWEPIVAPIRGAKFSSVQQLSFERRIFASVSYYEASVRRFKLIEHRSEDESHTVHDVLDQSPSNSSWNAETMDGGVLTFIEESWTAPVRTLQYDLNKRRLRIVSEHRHHVQPPENFEIHREFVPSTSFNDPVPVPITIICRRGLLRRSGTQDAPQRMILVRYI